MSRRGPAMCAARPRTRNAEKYGRQCNDSFSSLRVSRRRDAGQRPRRRPRARAQRRRRRRSRARARPHAPTRHCGERDAREAGLVRISAAAAAPPTPLSGHVAAACARASTEPPPACAEKQRRSAKRSAVTCARAAASGLNAAAFATTRRPNSAARVHAREADATDAPFAPPRLREGT